MSNFKKILLIIVLATISSFFLIEILGTTLKETLTEYLSYEAKVIATNIVTKSINDVMITKEVNNLFIVTKNKNNEIETMDYNTTKVNELLSEIHLAITSNILKIETGQFESIPISASLSNSMLKIKNNGLVCTIPLGSLKNNPFYSSFGPTIPLKMSFRSATKTKLTTKITPYGFNSIVIEVFAETEIIEQINLPMSSVQQKIVITTPLTLKVLHGTIPKEYYEKNLEKTNSII